MTTASIKKSINYIVGNSISLKNKYLGDDKSPIDWVCIFSQSDPEYQSLVKVTDSLGKIIQNTETGPIYRLDSPMITKAGSLLVLKIRKPDKTRPQRGDGDFRINDYTALKEKYLPGENFSLIKREDHEMIELRDPGFDVLVYFSNPPITKVLGVS